MLAILSELHQKPVQSSLFGESVAPKKYFQIESGTHSRAVGEFWTAKQRQANSIHEVAYRACFKAQLPNYFITLLTKPGDIIYDPFSGRGTTVIEAALLGRNGVANDISPISKILSEGRLSIPNISDIKLRLEKIVLDNTRTSDIDLSMFFHKDTLGEIVSLKDYFAWRTDQSSLDEIDKWIRMVATNRLTGHSVGYFSVYTLPPNQAVTPDRQVKINIKYEQLPTYRNIKEIIYKKSKNLLGGLSREQILNIKNSNVTFFTGDARETDFIADESIALTVTSPPFLDIVQYAQDNWLRCWFNGFDAKKIESGITMSKKVDDWTKVMRDVFKQLYRITKPNGWVAFEVGEIRSGKIKLEEYVIPLGELCGLACDCVMINEQIFTKTANIWGVSNNEKGTNSNRIVIFQKK
ncbi:MAG: DNA methyltransferase [Pyrinomonadaceae bacterium]